jgi:hypothetical protein
MKTTFNQDKIIKDDSENNKIEKKGIKAANQLSIISST